jgi:carbamate kinase
MIQQVLHNALRAQGINRDVVTVVTQVRISTSDPALKNPTKPIGSFMEEAQAMEKRKVENWSVVEDAGRGWRRVVPSPLPIPITRGL